MQHAHYVTCGPCASTCTILLLVLMLVKTRICVTCYIIGAVSKCCYKYNCYRISDLGRGCVVLELVAGGKIYTDFHTG